MMIKVGRVTLGNLLRLRRMQLNKTVYDIAKSVGVSHNAISYFEAGQIGVPGKRLAQFASAYELDYQDLLAWYLVCKLHDEGVTIGNIGRLASVIDRVTSLIDRTRRSSSTSERVLDNERHQPRVSRPDIQELHEKFCQSLQTLQLLERRAFG